MMPEPFLGAKYRRRIHSAVAGSDAFVTVDVYAVLEAFAVACPAVQHAVKKLLCAGLRGKADRVTDLEEARDAITRAIALERIRGEHEKDAESKP